MWEQELSKLVKRLEEANISTQRFLKIRENKAAFERGFQDKLYSPKDFPTVCNCMICRGIQSHSAWGIMGKDGLVLVDTDKAEMYQTLSKVLPETFEVTSPRRGLPHKYFIVTSEKVNNAVLHLPNDKDINGKFAGAGEIRASNQYLVAPGTETQHGTYKVTNDVPITKVSYEHFMKAVRPYIGAKGTKPKVKDIVKGVGEGMRHESGISYAVYLIKNLKLDQPTALYEMKRWNQDNNPPMSEKDLERMVKNAIDYKAKAPKSGKSNKDKVKNQPSAGGFYLMVQSTRW